MTLYFLTMLLSIRKYSIVASEYGKITNIKILSIQHSNYQTPRDVGWPKKCNHWRIVQLQWAFIKRQLQRMMSLAPWHGTMASASGDGMQKAGRQQVDGVMWIGWWEYVGSEMDCRWGWMTMVSDLIETQGDAKWSQAGGTKLIKPFGIESLANVFLYFFVLLY